MKMLPKVLAATLAIAALCIEGCVPGFRAAKPLPELEENARSETATTTDAGAPQKPALGESEIGSAARAPQEKSRAVARRALPATPRELREKDEINQSALEFAKAIPDVQHVKTCFSRIFGGWYLHLYVKKGKNISLQHYTWNHTTREWEVSLAVKELPVGELERHLRSEVEDEMCTVLK
jgi:hypothetical protein